MHQQGQKEVHKALQQSRFEKLRYTENYTELRLHATKPHLIFLRCHRLKCQ